MSALRALLARSAPLLACLGLLGIWQVASLILSTDSFPTAWEAIRTIPSILGDTESLINILASLRRMAIGFGLAVVVSIPLGLMMGRSRGVASFFNPLLMVTYPVPKAALMPIIMLWLGAGGAAGNPHRLPYRAGAGADHHGHQRDDRAAIWRRKYPV